jgi:hypothetical protein
VAEAEGKSVLQQLPPERTEAYDDVIVELTIDDDENDDPEPLTPLESTM